MSKKWASFTWRNLFCNRVCRLLNSIYLWETFYSPRTPHTMSATFCPKHSWEIYPRLAFRSQHKLSWCLLTSSGNFPIPEMMTETSWKMFCHCRSRRRCAALQVYKWVLLNRTANNYSTAMCEIRDHVNTLLYTHTSYHGLHTHCIYTTLFRKTVGGAWAIVDNASESTNRNRARKSKPLLSQVEEINFSPQLRDIRVVE